MSPTRTAIWPFFSTSLWVGVFGTGVVLAVLVPWLRPLLSDCAPILFLIPGAAAAGHVPHYARRIETIGEWNWQAWRYRAAGLAMSALAFAGWWQMVNAPRDTSTLIGILTFLAQTAMLGVLLLAEIAGNTDQRDENERMALDFVNQYRH